MGMPYNCSMGAADRTFHGQKDAPDGYLSLDLKPCGLYCADLFSLSFLGDLIDGKEAYRIGLATSSVPEDQIEAEVEKWASKMENIPANQLSMHKLLVNSAVEPQLGQQQILANLFDGFARHSPEGAAFKRYAEEHGWKAAVAQRDGPKSKL